MRAKRKPGRAKQETKDAERIEDSMSSQLLLELLPHEDIPDDLQRTYLGTSVEAQLVRHLIMRAASHDRPVLIIGDTGTGKEIIARATSRTTSAWL